MAQSDRGGEDPVAVDEAPGRPGPGRPSLRRLCSQEARKGSRHGAGPRHPDGTSLFLLFSNVCSGISADTYWQWDGKNAIWTPPKMWTAWPLAEGRLPTEDLVARREDEDEAFTFRKQETKMPSSDLQDELSASILRMAKKRFTKRKRTWEATRPSVEDPIISSPAAEGSRPPSPSGAESSQAVSRATSANPPSGQDSQGLEDDGHGSSAGTRARARRQARGYDYEPVVSADDQLSYKLLEPPARHILSQLDATLQILHHTRSLGPGYDSDSSTADDEEPDTQQDTSNNNTPKKRPRGRPRKAGIDEKKPDATKRGRPRKVPIPLEGESHKEMLIRIARDGHRRLPVHAKAAKVGFGVSIKQETETDTHGEDLDDDFEAWFHRSTRRGARVWGLRDWSDVIGAASLAGFSPGVIARTTKRCADLFGESMTIRNFHEVPASAGTGVRTVEYRPEPIHLSASDADDTDNPPPPSDDDREASLHLHRRIASRQSSQAPSSPRGRFSASPSPSQPRSRSRSASTGQQHFCPVPTCARAVGGFSRRANLARHMKLVHGGMTPGDASTTGGGGTGASEVDSEDEVLGAVHVDGFLRAVVPSRGWRGEDMMTRRRKKFWGERKIRERDAESEDGSRDGDVSS